MPASTSGRVLEPAPVNASVRVALTPPTAEPVVKAIGIDTRSAP